MEAGWRGAPEVHCHWVCNAPALGAKGIELPLCRLGEASHQPDDVVHDGIELEVLGRVDGGDAETLQGCRVLRRDDAPHHHGDIVEAFLAHAAHHLADQRHVAARQYRQAYHVHRFFSRRADDLRRGEPYALVDDLHATIPCAHGDLLGTVGVAVEARLADEELDAPSEPGRHALHLAAHLLEAYSGGRHAPRDAGGCAVFAKNATQGRAQHA